MNTKFNVGDIVRHTSAEDCSALDSGTVIGIVGQTDTETIYSVRWSEENEYTHFESFLMLVQPYPEGNKDEEL